MNMNGGPSTDPHHPRPGGNGGYLGLGIPGIPSLSSTTAAQQLQIPGNGGFLGSPAGAAAAAAAAAGMGMSPDLKHHADFLSRLLAATPSYMNEAGSPPPGFFSDWLRRLVSKPGNGGVGGSGGGGSGGTTTSHSHSRRGGSGAHGHSGLTSPPPSSTPTQPPLTYSPVGSGSRLGQEHPEMNGSGQLDNPHSHGMGTGSSGSGGSTGKQPRRKRTRLSDHGGHQPHSISQLANQEGSGHNMSHDHSAISPIHLNSQSSGSTMAATSSASSSASSISATAAAAAAASMNVNPFTHPLWFFPPFLPNPYMNMNPMSMPPMSLSGLHGNQPPPTSPFLSTSSAADNHLQHLHPHLSPHHFGSPPDFLSSLNKSREAVAAANAAVAARNEEKSKSPGAGASNTNTSTAPTPAPPPKRNRKDNSTPKQNKSKSSSFSISRLTSPSPSSNSSGGSGGGRHSHSHNNHPLTIEALNRNSSICDIPSKKPKTTTSPESRPGSGNSSIGGGNGNSSGNLNGGGGSGSTTKPGSVCVDLRVSGRIWERSPPPRSIYKPLSAFHDPSDVNLVHLSPKQLKRGSGSPDNTRLPPLPLLLKHPDSAANAKSTSSTPLSTTYVLKNLTHIYQRLGQQKSKMNATTSTATTPMTSNSNSQSLSKYSALSILNHSSSANLSHNTSSSYLDSLMLSDNESINEEQPHSQSSSRSRDSPPNNFEMFPAVVVPKREQPENSAEIKIPLPARPSTTLTIPTTTSMQHLSDTQIQQNKSQAQNYAGSNGLTLNNNRDRDREEDLEILDPENDDDPDDEQEQKVFNHMNTSGSPNNNVDIRKPKDYAAILRQDFSDSEPEEDILDDDDIVNVMSDDAESDNATTTTTTGARRQELDKY